MNVEAPVSINFWNDVARACPWATYFHGPQWALCMVKTFPEFAPGGIGFTLDDGTRAVFPSVVREKKGFLKRKKEYKSMEPGVYGGFIADRQLSRECIDSLAAHMLAEKKASGRIVESPFQPLGLGTPFIAKNMFTHVVDLVPGFEVLAGTFSRGQKSNINQAKKKKVAIRQAEREADIEQYYEIYQQTLTRWGDQAGEAYPLEFFFNLYAQKDSGVLFRLAEAEGRMIAGVVLLVWNKKVVYWHGCALQEYFRHYPNNLLHASVIEWGCRSGLDAYDMGPSMGLEGVIKFKESFGARRVHFKAYRWK